MSVSSHLRISPAEYDVRIRNLIPLYDELIAETAAAIGTAERPVRQIVDLGIGTGALASACLRVAPRTRIWGVDADADMMAMARARLGRRAARVHFVHASFLDVDLPPCDVIVASYALHHIKSPARKQAFYRRCAAALRPGGALVSGDCMPASSARGFAADLERWYDHLGKTFGRAKGKKVYASWADEDRYMPLADELRMLARAGLQTDVPWRRSPFAVVVGVKRKRS